MEQFIFFNNQQFENSSAAGPTGFENSEGASLASPSFEKGDYYTDGIIKNSKDLLNKLKVWLYKTAGTDIRAYNFFTLVNEYPVHYIGYNNIEDNRLIINNFYISPEHIDNSLNLLQWSIKVLSTVNDVKIDSVIAYPYSTQKDSINILSTFGFQEDKDLYDIGNGQSTFIFKVSNNRLFYFTKYDAVEGDYMEFGNPQMYKDHTLIYSVTEYIKQNCRQVGTVDYNFASKTKEVNGYIGVNMNPLYYKITKIYPIENDTIKDLLIFTIKTLANEKDEIDELTISVKNNSPLFKLLQSIGFEKKDGYMSIKLSSFEFNLKHKIGGLKYKSIAENITNYPSLVQWRNDHINNLCYVVSTFFNYISIDRIDEGFSIVKSTDTIKDRIAVTPKITWDQVNYLLSEIFPCADMLKESEYMINRIPEDLKFVILKGIKTELSNKKILNLREFEINPNALQLIWNYISNGINTLYYTGYEGSISDQDIKDNISFSESISLTRRELMKNYGFNDEIENCAFQAILYVSVALADWLSIDYIGVNEITTAYKIIVPKNLQDNPSESSNKVYEEIISSAILDRQLIPKSEGIKTCVWIMNWLSNKLRNIDSPDTLKIINRFMSFSNPV